MTDFGHSRIGQTIDPIQTLPIGGAGRDVRHVVVAGRAAVVDGQIPSMDTGAASQCAEAQFEGLMARYPERIWRRPPSMILPAAAPARARDA